MNYYRQFTYLLTFVAIISFLLVVGAMFGLYRISFEQQRARLVETAHSQARLMEAIARFDAEYHQDEFPGGAFEATLSQIRNAHENFEGFGKTGEFTLAKRQDDRVVFVLSHRNDTQTIPEPIPFTSELAEPMRCALEDRSGSLVGKDYRGTMVLAAYEPVAVLNLGVVAKIDVDEIRAPFLKAGLLSLCAVFGCIFVFMRIVARILDDLVESRAMFGGILETAADSIISIDEKGIIQAFNAAAEDTLGFRAREVIGKNVSLLVPSPDSEKHDSYIQRYLDTDEAHIVGTGREIDVQKKDGTTFSAHLAISEMKHKNHRIFNGIIVDLTEQKRVQREIQMLNEELEERVRVRTDALKESQAQLFQSQKMEAVGRLAGGIAHDFNNLLTAILGYSELVLMNSDLNARLTRDVTGIHDAGLRAKELTSQLLAFSRKQIMEPVALDLRELIAHADGILRRVIGEDIAMRYDTSTDPGTVQADPGQLEQVLMNLVINASDAMPDGGKITVKLRNLDVATRLSTYQGVVEPGSYVVLSIRDTGVGMNDETRLRVFEPFFTTKESGKGTGLGLSMVFGIVKQSDGEIFVESVPEEGTAIHIYFPRLDAGAKEEVRTALPEKGNSEGGPETILVVDDEPEILKIVDRLLTHSGYEVVCAANPEEALSRASEMGAFINLLVTDVIMPKTDGRVLANKLAKDFPELRVLFMSGYSGEKVDHRGVLEDGLNFISKPFHVQELLEKVREVLEDSLPYMRSN